MKHAIWVGIALLCGLAFVAPARADEPVKEEEKKEIKHTTDTLEKVLSNIEKKKAFLLDVRELKEWEEAHVKGARLLPLTELDKMKEDEEWVKTLKKRLPKGKIVYTHCRAGRRALTAAALLEELGFKVRALKPGTAELLEGGFEKATEEDDKELAEIEAAALAADDEAEDDDDEAEDDDDEAEDDDDEAEVDEDEDEDEDDEEDEDDDR